MLTANNGAFTTTFTSTMLGLTRQTGNGLTVSFVRTPDGQLIAATTGTNSAYFLTDNLGSTVGIVTSSGVKTAAYAYDPYGRTRTATGTTAAANAIRYAGGLFDTTTGATKFGARYYDPNTGRFTQPDPSGQEQNPYAYAGNNPITYNDPSGLCGEWYSPVSCDEILYDTATLQRSYTSALSGVRPRQQQQRSVQWRLGRFLSFQQWPYS
jgi:RHS repeat-associated protein